MVWKDKSDTFASYVRKKAKGLLLPYLIVLALGALFTYLVPEYRTQNITEELKWAFLYTQPEWYNVGQIWFLVCLMLRLFTTS